MSAFSIGNPPPANNRESRHCPAVSDILSLICWAIVVVALATVVAPSSPVASWHKRTPKSTLSWTRASYAQLTPTETPPTKGVELHCALSAVTASTSKVESKVFCWSWPVTPLQERRDSLNEAWKVRAAVGASP